MRSQRLWAILTGYERDAVGCLIARGMAGVYIPQLLRGEPLLGKHLDSCNG